VQVPSRFVIPGDYIDMNLQELKKQVAVLLALVLRKGKRLSLSILRRLHIGVELVVRESRAL
jgi:hypothetical protein